MRRVVVTGMSAITPYGQEVAALWNALLEGKSAVSRISMFDPSNHPVHINAEVKDFDPGEHFPTKESRKIDRFIQFALVASRKAWKDAGFGTDQYDPARAGVVIGSACGGLHFIEEQWLTLEKKSPKRVSPFLIPGCLINSASGYISIEFNLKGPNCAVATACAAGNHAIGDAYQLIQLGKADIMLAGGSEAAITPLSLAGFSNMRALSRRNDEPEKASRPFDKDRDGFVIGEGAALIVLEELDHALARNARIYAEIIGYGLSGDAHHITAAAPEGEGAYLALQMALRTADIQPEQVDYINAHGTATISNDVNETKAIKRVFRENAYQIPVSSIKSMLGHLLGAAGAVEAIACILSVKENMLPPTINLDNPDPECDLDFIKEGARQKETNIAVNNSFGFGGTNAVTIFRKWN